MSASGDAARAPQTPRAVPTFIVDSASNFFERVTVSIQSNGGSSEVELSADAWPKPAPGMMNVQVQNGHHVWVKTPTSNERAASFVSWATFAAAMTAALMLAALALKIHVHGLRRRNFKYGMVTMCVGTGMGAAGIIERL